MESCGDFGILFQGLSEFGELFVALKKALVFMLIYNEKSQRNR